MLFPRLLNYTLDTNIIGSQDAPYLLGNIASSSRIGRELTWQFVKKNLDMLLGRYGNELFLLARMFSSVLSSFSTEQDLKDIELFFDNVKDLGSGNQAVKQSIEKIKSKIEWKKRNEADLNRWLTYNVN